MPAIVSSHKSHTGRRRRTHVKSRGGCGNCKLRRVKCDEHRPQCQKCNAYGVACSFDRTEESLQLVAQGSFQVNLTEDLLQEYAMKPDAQAPQKRLAMIDVLENKASLSQSSRSLSSIIPQSFDSSVGYGTGTSSRYCHKPSKPISSHSPILEPLCSISINASTASMINTALQYECTSMETMADTFENGVPFWQFSGAQLEILTRFRNRTALTIGDARVASVYRDILCQLAMKNPFLMHMLLSLTLMHDAHLAAQCSSSQAAQQTNLSLQHFNAATKLFYGLLAGPIPPSKRDPVWASGVIIGAASFWFVNSNNTAEVWPLKPSEPNDLAWLKLGEGKKSLWKISDPARPDSMFYEVMKGKTLSFCGTLPDCVFEVNILTQLPKYIQDIFEIIPESTIENNVYHLPLIFLSRVQDMLLTQSNLLNFLYFSTFITPELIALLEEKDPRAIFLVGWWFKMVAVGDLWWMANRARIEGEAVRTWLQREEKVYGLALLLDSL